MPRTPAQFTQADVARLICAAKQAGAAEIEVKLGSEVTATVRLTDVENSPLAPARPIVL